MYVGDNSSVEAKWIGTCKLTLHGGCIILLHDFVYALEIQWNLVSILVLKLRCNLNFYGVCLEIFLNSVLTRTAHLVNGFIVLDTILDGSCYDNSCFHMLLLLVIIR